MMLSAILNMGTDQYTRLSLSILVSYQQSFRDHQKVDTSCQEWALECFSIAHITPNGIQRKSFIVGSKQGGRRF